MAFRVLGVQMSDGMAGEEGGVGCATQAPAAPDDEAVAYVRPRSGLLTLAPWFAALATVALLQYHDVVWLVTDGRLRAAAELAAPLLGFGIGVAAGSRTDLPWVRWPPSGALMWRGTRIRASDVAHAWWRFLWLVPFTVASAGMLLVLVLVGALRPYELVGQVHVSNLAWSALIAGALGAALGRDVLRHDAEAITARGIHTATLSFVPWEALSHAIVEPEEGIIRLYTRRRPWLPRNVVSYASRQQLEQAVALISEHLRCLSREDEPRAYRARWLLHLVEVTAVVLLLTALGLGLLLVPMLVFQPWWHLKTARTLAGLFAHMPELSLVVALAGGAVLDSVLERLRGVTTKRVVTESA